MMKQIYGDAMGVPLGSALHNIFVRKFYEAKLFGNVKKPSLYHRHLIKTSFQRSAMKRVAKSFFAMSMLSMLLYALLLKNNATIILLLSTF